MVTKKSKWERDFEREFLKKLFLEKRRKLATTKKASSQEIKEIREIIKKLRKLR